MSLADCTPALCSNTRVEGAAVLVARRRAATLGCFRSRLGAWLASRAFLAGLLVKHEVRWRTILRHQTSPLHEAVACGEQAVRWASCPSSSRTFSWGARDIVPLFHRWEPKVM